MRKIVVTTVIAWALQVAAPVHSQQANSNQGNGSASDEPVLGVTVVELNEIVAGWSAKRDILGKPVYNDQNQKIGQVDDIIITPDDAVAFAIIGAGGFLGIGKHDVAIPVDQIENRNNRFVLPGATKAALKAMPAFDYGRKR